MQKKKYILLLLELSSREKKIMNESQSSRKYRSYPHMHKDK